MRLTVTSEKSIRTQVGLPYKNDRGARRRISKTPLKGTKSCFMGAAQIHVEVLIIPKILVIYANTLTVLSIFRTITLISSKLQQL